MFILSVSRVLKDLRETKEQQVLKGRGGRKDIEASPDSTVCPEIP